MIKAQGATISDFNDFIHVKEIIPLPAKKCGYIEKIDALTLGVSAMKLGAGRERKEDSIDPDVGIVLNHQIGEYVEKGEALLYIYKNDKWDDSIIDDLYSAYSITKNKIKPVDVVSKIIE